MSRATQQTFAFDIETTNAKSKQDTIEHMNTSPRVHSEDENVSSWVELTLDAVGTIYSGATPSTSIRTFWDGDIVWITPYDLSRLNTSGITDSARRITEKGLKGCSAHLLPPECVVLSSRAPIGYLAIPKAPFCTNQGCKTIKPKERISKDFLYYNLMFNINKVKNLGEGTTFAEISRAALSTVKLWFPTPKIEQAKIAEILSTVDRAIEQTEALIAKQQRIKAGLMQDLLTRGIDENGMTRSEATHTFQDSCLGRIPVEWKVGPIESRLENIIDYRGRTPTKTEMGIPLLTAKNVRDGYLSEEPREFIAEENYNRWMTRGIPAIGHVIFTTEAPMGNVARIPKYKIALAQRLITLVPKTFNLRDGFLFWLLHWARTRERLELLASGSTVSGIKQSVFRRVEFAFPVIEEQERIEHILNAVNEKVVDDSSHLLKLRRMKTSLMQDLLTGKRRVTPLLSSAPNQ